MTSKSELKRQNIMRGRPMMEGIETLTRLDTLKSLQKRIREATGPDRELDRLIVCALLAPEGSRVVHTGVRDEWVISDKPDRRWWPDDPGVFKLAYNSSLTTDPDGLGACVALMREVLPGAMWERTYIRRVWVNGHGATPLANDCLTFLDAIIAARIAEIEVKEKANAQ